jgi:hypothetical protein
MWAYGPTTRPPVGVFLPLIVSFGAAVGAGCYEGKAKARLVRLQGLGAPAYSPHSRA